MPQYKNIFEAINYNDIEAVKSFLPEQLEIRDKYGRTPFHLTCDYGYAGIARLLLDSGADIEARNIYGFTSLHNCCNYNRIEIAYLLLDYNANIEARGDGDWVPLHCACYHGNHSMSELLVSRGADPYVLDEKGYTPLDFEFDYDDGMIKEKYGDDNEIPHKEILIRLRAEYLNKQILKNSERTAALSSGWEMEM